MDTKSLWRILERMQADHRCARLLLRVPSKRPQERRLVALPGFDEDHPDFEAVMRQVDLHRARAKPFSAPSFSSLFF